ncbi:hypothetical protein M7I_5350 [Glarea lozoyensis 74030]|uniref:Uncharacterized protein n=1 Tax=Glarea lozoyensis (strain ATCC 74030 / MF5533) TaxID=1104152 RepID=H0ERM9_GLAL7|nr:hypothetical protein M7I_5350 [Glarea lozoyensis 74030]
MSNFPKLIPAFTTNAPSPMAPPSQSQPSAPKTPSYAPNQIIP